MSAKKKSAIAIDNWKLPIFEHHLKQSGYSYTNAGTLTHGTMILTVETENMDALQEVVKAANLEAARTKP